MAERKYEQTLGIRTSGLREWRNRKVPYNRYEPTPYKALEQLFREYKIERNDKVVDYGCGRGRVTFYIHHRFRVPVTGIEVNDLTFDEAIDNKASYRMKAKHIEAPIRLKYGLAEQYEVKNTDTLFYFFNPFSVQIFEKVLQQITASIREHQRTVDIILYYPLQSYKRVMQETEFTLINRIPVPEINDPQAKFLIYRYQVKE